MNKFFFKLDDKVLNVSGIKAKDYLHGQLSNDIKSLQVNEGNYNLYLTKKGKIMADLFVLKGDHDFLLFVSNGLKDRVQEGLSRLARLSKVEIIENENFKITHIMGESLFQLEPFQSVNFTLVDGSVVLVFRTDRMGTEGFDLIYKKEFEESVAQFLKKNNIEEISENSLEKIRIINGVAMFGKDFNEENLPQEANLDRALNFNKGCYLGQEIIARIHFKGHVNKVLQRLKSNSQISVGDEIKNKDEKIIGKVTSVYFDENENQSYLLAYLPYRFDVNHELVKISGNVLQPLESL